MNQEINITVNVIMPTVENDSDRQWRGMQNFAVAVKRMWENKIAYEQARGNPNWSHVETQEQYQAAIAADDRQRREELGFWKYHFGS